MTEEKLRVLVLGGYGNFGQIIVKRLAMIEGIEVIVAGRNLAKAEALVTSCGGSAVQLDANQADLVEVLDKLHVHVLISTAGPFQGQDYTVAKAAISANCHYIDLADAREFVCGITELDPAAKKKNLLICSGASSVPGLSSAVVDEFLSEFSELKTINYGISASEKTPGISTVESVLNYCGKPFKQWKNHQWQKVYGWQNLHQHHFRKAIGNRLIASCDIPDLALFPARYPNIANVNFSAGVGLRTTQVGTWCLSWLIRSGLIRNPKKFSKILHKSAVLLEPLGNGLSGMFIYLEGVGQDQKPLKILWELVAFDNEGPNIPCLAAIALIRKLKDGRLDARGAMSSMGLLTLAEYLHELKEFPIEIDVYRDI